MRNKALPRSSALLFLKSKHTTEYKLPHPFNICGNIFSVGAFKFAIDDASVNAVIVPGV